MRTQLYSNYTCYFSITEKKNPLLFLNVLTCSCFALLKGSDRSVYKCATMIKFMSSCMVLFLYLIKTTCEELLVQWWKKNLLSLFSNIDQEPLHKSKKTKKKPLQSVSLFLWTSWIGGRPLPGSCPPRLMLHESSLILMLTVRRGVSQAWKGSAESHKSPNAPVIAVLLSCQG